MVNKIIQKGKRFLTNPQESVLSAATIIMIMIVASRVLGLVRQRVLAHFFTPSELSLFFAAFRLPDLLFEILVFGTFSSAFIPVFTKSLKKGNSHAWEIASTVVNLGLVIFISVALVLSISADKLYGLLAPGYNLADQQQIAYLARILFAAQGFFVVSYVLTGVLESLRRFLIPALAPLFYNLGIILGTLFLAPKFGLLAPVIGVVVGAFSHFIVQLPFAYAFGFRFKPKIEVNEDVRKIGRLAFPRLIETSFLQISKSAELFFASLISVPAYTYYTFGNTLQLLPIGLFGTSIAKAALPTLARQSDDLRKFKKTLLDALYQVVFLVLPVSAALIVLRVPIVRLVYGTDIFGWEATVQTGYVLSAFGVGIVFQSANAIMARGFYALHNTKTPVVISVGAIILTLILDYLFIRVFHFEVWGLAAALTIGVFVQSFFLFYLINKQFGSFSLKLLKPFAKSTFASAFSGTFMYFMLKFFDRSVWVKELSFLGRIDADKYIPFQRFVLDTRYTANLLILTMFVLLTGAVLYIGLSIAFGSQEVWVFFNQIKRVFIRRQVAPIPKKEEEQVAPPTSDTPGL
ncbi:murein biosynthesis integral membrane protein MurJ [Candidatus Woesebacteria bacterium RIFCSPHIGHO2_01_FULL_39_32]|uniref:Probable lipid II flippase MurJ n=2 Tax=Candidatus Woeseibacteriota TaxID=1752722 RepID=A0A0G0PMF0_9BACT|nr:MAG: Integral membrane protein MviN [Candidatus Woesebacteria bacterium GW2011_GWA1_39_8]OGM24772.1 MAG: murein biosynthesis integral membrane protein MurJ [Candidatus Woesebacteria bacterium RIFCSPHIGHO2_01_FULL_39_32]OGM37093.1 MAG: murein biosynthesis integral membrane protein MurJ [Candidatus Woesebacteria bacterium RIFCSPHIGHO2_12_FULL_38_11]OGM64598.1 MAG: murein biosynthesis integral membrane protein MurJ [Candidatus Woesebacteria bacterium RIFCSPLOWO2_01_FULL_39_25]